MFSHVTGRLPVHPDDAVHPSTAGPNEHGGGSPRPASTTSSAGFPSTPSTGRPSGLLSTLHNPSFEPQAVRLSGDATTYYVKNPSNTKTPQPLYTRDPETGVLKQTSKQVVSDGAGWRLEKGLTGGNGPSHPSRADELHAAQTGYDRAKIRDDAAQAEKESAEGQLADANAAEKATRQNFENAWIECDQTAQIANDYTLPGAARASARRALPELQRVREDSLSAYTLANTTRQTAAAAAERARTHAATTAAALHQADQNLRQREQTR